MARFSCRNSMMDQFGRSDRAAPTVRIQRIAVPSDSKSASQISRAIPDSSKNDSS